MGQRAPAPRTSFGERYDGELPLQHRTVPCIVGSWRVLQVGLIEHFPIINLVMMIGDMPHPVFIREPAQRVPAHQSRVIVDQLLLAGIA